MGRGSEKSLSAQIVSTVRRAWMFQQCRVIALVLLIVGLCILAFSSLGGSPSHLPGRLAVYHEPIHSKAQKYSSKNLACLIVGDTFTQEQTSAQEHLDSLNELFLMLVAYDTYLSPYCDLKVFVINNSQADFPFDIGTIQSKLPNSEVTFIPRNDEKYALARRIDHYHVMTYAYHYFDYYDWYLKIHDVDSILMPDNFLKLVYDKQSNTKYDMSKPQLLGHSIQDECHDYVYSRTAYAFNKAFLKTVGAIASQHISAGFMELGHVIECQTRQGCESPYDDDFAAFCLEDLDIFVTPTRDEQDRDYFLIWTVRQHYVKLNEWKEDWYWVGKSKTSVAENCCAEYPVVFSGYMEEKRLVKDIQEIYSVPEDQRNMKFLSKVRPFDDSPIQVDDPKDRLDNPVDVDNDS